MEFEDFFDVLLANFKKILYPEEFLTLDFAFSKMELFAMVIVDRHKEMMMSQVADCLNIPMSTASGIIDRLVKNGYMSRERSETDRRIVVVKLTGRGQETVTAIKSTVNGYMNTISDALSDEERQELYQILMKIVDVIGRKNEAEAAVKVKETEIQKIEID